MKKGLCVLMALLMIGALSGCSQRGTVSSDVIPTSAFATEGTTETTETTISEARNMNKMTVTIGNRVFTATLYDNETAKAFVKRLPLTLNMQELNGNEKYLYLDNPLPSASSVPKSINTGDIKLFGSDCLVLFYDSFTTSYSYTDIGAIDNPEGLKEALGKGDASVTFTMES